MAREMSVFVELSQLDWGIIAKEWQRRRQMVVKCVRERERWTGKEKWLGFCFVLLGLGLWLSANCGKWNLMTLVGHVTCTCLKTDVSFKSCHITLFATTPTNMFAGNPCPFEFYWFFLIHMPSYDCPVQSYG